MTRLTRRYRFPASHRLHNPEMTEAANQRLYGKCNNPYGHGHDYILEVSVIGPIDQHGRVTDRADAGPGLWTRPFCAISGTQT